MRNMNEFYIEKMCYEFSRLLYDISEEHHRIYCEWEQKYSALEIKCHEYELQLSKVREENGSFIFVVRIKVYKCGRFLWKYGKKPCIRLARNIFSLGRFLTTRLGIKKLLKRSRLFQRLYAHGLIDKLRE